MTRYELHRQLFTGWHPTEDSERDLDDVIDDGIAILILATAHDNCVAELEAENEYLGRSKRELTAGLIQQIETLASECEDLKVEVTKLQQLSTSTERLEAERDALVAALREDHETLSSVVDWPERSHDVSKCPTCALLAKYPQEAKP